MALWRRLVPAILFYISKTETDIKTRIETKARNCGRTVQEADMVIRVQK